MARTLHQQLADEAARLQRYRAQAADPDASPQAKHSAGVIVESAERRQADLLTATGESVGWIQLLEDLVIQISNSRMGSADRTLALRHIEDASMRLQRELGTNQSC